MVDRRVWAPPRRALTPPPPRARGSHLHRSVPAACHPPLVRPCAYSAPLEDLPSRRPSTRQRAANDDGAAGRPSPLSMSPRLALASAADDRPPPPAVPDSRQPPPALRTELGVGVPGHWPRWPAGPSTRQSRSSTGWPAGAAIVWTPSSLRRPLDRRRLPAPLSHAMRGEGSSAALAPYQTRRGGGDAGRAGHRHRDRAGRPATFYSAFQPPSPFCSQPSLPVDRVMRCHSVPPWHHLPLSREGRAAPAATAGGSSHPPPPHKAPRAGPQARQRGGRPSRGER